MSYKSRKVLKTEAKEALKKDVKANILTTLIPSLLIIFGLASLSIPVNQLTAEVYNTNVLFTGALSVLFTLVYTGSSYTFLDQIRGKKEAHPFKRSLQVFTKSLFLPLLLLILLSYVFTLLWGILLIIPGIIKSIAYSQATLIYKDDKAKTQSMKDYITQSRALMYGHKKRYFLIQLSFIPWHILSILTFGLGYLVLIPYITLTNVLFYEDLRKTSIPLS